MEIDNCRAAALFSAPSFHLFGALSKQTANRQRDTKHGEKVLHLTAKSSFDITRRNKYALRHHQQITILFFNLRTIFFVSLQTCYWKDSFSFLLYFFRLMARRDVQQKKKSDEWQLRTAHLIWVVCGAAAGAAAVAAASEANEISVFCFETFELFAEADDGTWMMDDSVRAVNWYNFWFLSLSTFPTRFGFSMKHHQRSFSSNSVVSYWIQ